MLDGRRFSIALVVQIKLDVIRGDVVTNSENTGIGHNVEWQHPVVLSWLTRKSRTQMVVSSGNQISGQALWCRDIKLARLLPLSLSTVDTVKVVVVGQVDTSGGRVSWDTPTFTLVLDVLRL
ncbi:hypothetical protein D3C80_1838450 [compost metagenome]